MHTLIKHTFLHRYFLPKMTTKARSHKVLNCLQYKGVKNVNSQKIYTQKNTWKYIQQLNRFIIEQTFMKFETFRL